MQGVLTANGISEAVRGLGGWKRCVATFVLSLSGGLQDVGWSIEIGQLFDPIELGCDFL